MKIATQTLKIFDFFLKKSYSNVVCLISSEIIVYLSRVYADVIYLNEPSILLARFPFPYSRGKQTSYVFSSYDLAPQCEEGFSALRISKKTVIGSEAQLKQAGRQL